MYGKIKQLIFPFFLPLLLHGGDTINITITITNYWSDRLPRERDRDAIFAFPLLFDSISFFLFNVIHTFVNIFSCKNIYKCFMLFMFWHLNKMAVDCSKRITKEKIFFLYLLLFVEKKAEKNPILSLLINEKPIFWCFTQ